MGPLATFSIEQKLSSWHGSTRPGRRRTAAVRERGLPGEDHAAALVPRARFALSDFGASGRCLDHVRNSASGVGCGRGTRNARLVAESLAPGACISEIARRNGVVPSLLFIWRRRARVRVPEPVFLPMRPAERPREARL